MNEIFWFLLEGCHKINEQWESDNAGLTEKLQSTLESVNAGLTEKLQSTLERDNNGATLNHQSPITQLVLCNF